MSNPIIAALKSGKLSIGCPIKAKPLEPSDLVRLRAAIERVAAQEANTVITSQELDDDSQNLRADPE